MRLPDRVVCEIRGEAEETVEHRIWSMLHSYVDTSDIDCKYFSLIVFRQWSSVNLSRRYGKCACVKTRTLRASRVFRNLKFGGNERTGQKCHILRIYTSLSSHYSKFHTKCKGVLTHSNKTAVQCCITSAITMLWLHWTNWSLMFPCPLTIAVQIL
jgi:hypothetical protein